MKKMAAVGIAIVLLMSALCARADLQILEGQHYARAPQDILDNSLVKEVGKGPADQIHVLEFFSYGCAGCHKLDPLVETWRSNLPPNVTFQRIPVEFHTEWRNLTKAYFTALNLNVMDKFHTPFFDAIHSGKVTSSSDDTIRQFFVAQGVPQKDFDKEYDSFSLNRKQKWAASVTRAYRVTAVPALIVQGPKGIFVTTGRLAGTPENMIAILNHLIKIEKGEIQASLSPDAVVPTQAEEPTTTNTTTQTTPAPTKTSALQKILAYFKTRN